MNLRGQVMNWTSEFDMDFKQNVSMVSEFMSRFNGKQQIFYQLPDSMQARANLIHLFDREWLFNQKDSMQNEVMKFVDTILSDSVMIHYEDSTWFAEVACHGIFKGKSHFITLFLKPEKIKEFVYRWVIVGAKGDLFKMEPPKRNHGLDIMPNNHEVSFIAIPKLEQIGNEYILNFSQMSYEPEALAVFYSLVYSGTLKIKSTESPIYHFLQVPGYVFVVRRFSREEANAGWLIDSLIKTNEDMKFDYLNKRIKE